MTDQQKNEERLAAWDRYLASRNDLLAIKNKIESWRHSLNNLSGKLENGPNALHESDFGSIPSRPDFEDTVTELRTARKEFERSSALARHNGFTVEEEPYAS